MERPELVVLVADLDIEQAVKGLFDRRTEAPESGGFATSSCVTPWLGMVAFKRANTVLAIQFRSSVSCIGPFDRAWDGAPSNDARNAWLRMSRSSLPRRWGDRARCVVLDPEIEVWRFLTPHVDRTLGLAEGSAPSLVA